MIVVKVIAIKHIKEYLLRVDIFNQLHVLLALDRFQCL